MSKNQFNFKKKHNTNKIQTYSNKNTIQSSNIKIIKFLIKSNFSFSRYEDIVMDLNNLMSRYHK